MFRRRLPLALGAAALALGAAALAAAQSPAGPGPLASVVNQVLALFPKVEGEVIEVQGQNVTLTIGRRDGLQPGIELSLFREGRELKHPKTGEVLGRAEQQLGRVAVTDVQEAFSAGTLVQAKDAKPGDRVRVSAGKVRLTLVTFVTNVRDNLAELVVQELVNGLNATGRFQVAMGDQVGALLAQERIPVEEFLQQGKGLAMVAQRLKVDHLLVVHLTRAQNRPFLEVRHFAPPRTEPLLASTMFVPSSIRPTPQGPGSVSGRRDPTEPTGPKRSFLARILGGEMEAGQYSSGQGALGLREVAKFPFPVVGMDVAVAPKDGVPRVVVTDGLRVFMYRLVNYVLEPEWTFSRTNGSVLTVQVADVDGDGELEAVINQHHRENGLTAAVISGKGGKTQVVADDSDWIVLAVDATGDGVKRQLWGQPYSADTFFSSKSVSKLVIRNGSFAADGRVFAPPGFRPIGATLSNVAGKTRALAFLDAQQRLQIWVDGSEVWTSATAVGGGFLRAEIVKQTDRAGRSFFFPIEPQPLSVDLDGDGVEEVVVPQNRVEGVLAVVYKGPAGLRLQSINSGHDGAITALGAIPSQTSPAILAAVVRFSTFLKTSGTTQIIMTAPD
jgi:hypothetical protein